MARRKPTSVVQRARPKVKVTGRVTVTVNRIVVKMEGLLPVLCLPSSLLKATKPSLIVQFSTVLYGMVLPTVGGFVVANGGLCSKNLLWVGHRRRLA